MFPAENKVESLPAAPGHSCSGPFFVFSLGLFFFYLAWLFLPSLFKKSPASSLSVVQVPGLSGLVRVPASYSGCPGIKLLKVYTQAVLIFTYK